MDDYDGNDSGFDGLDGGFDDIESDALGGLSDSGMMDIPESDHSIENSENLMEEENVNSDIGIVNQILSVSEEDLVNSNETNLMDEKPGEETVQPVNQILEIRDDDIKADPIDESKESIDESPKSEIERAMDETFDKKSDDISEKEDFEAVNPRFNEGKEFQENCQRCVPTCEMRGRGYDVTAKPNYDINNDALSYAPFSVWDNADIIGTTGSGKEDIEAKMAEWGDGARAEIDVAWTPLDGHVFMAEQVNGHTVFYDPQDGSRDCSDYFNQAMADHTSFARIDDAQPNALIFDCCERRA